MKDTTSINKFRISDEVIITALDVLGKVLLALISAKGPH